MLDAVVWRDYPLLQGLVLFTGLLLVLTNLAVDIGYAFFDPRIRESYQMA
jgi:peptide/nickel transport system permease protein